MKSLSVFRINGNSGMSGDIPNSMSNLAKLSFFDVSNSGLSGGIPSLFSNLSNMQYFLAAENSFNGPLPSLDKLTKLRKFLVFM